jgi:hypothetical protein
LGLSVLDCFVEQSAHPRIAELSGAPSISRIKRATSAITHGGATPDLGGDAWTDAFATTVIAALEAG